MTQARNLADSGVQLPLLTVLWWGGSRSSIPAGFAPADGQVMSRSTYPDAWTFVSGGGWSSVTDAVWTANPNQRNKFSTGDGSTTFRLPDINGKSVGSLGALFLRGDGTLSESSGNIQTDALQNITGKFYERRLNDGTNNFYTDANSGVFTLGVATGPSMTRSSATVGAALSADTMNFDASKVVRTADETRPLNAPGCYIIKLADEALDYSSVNMVQLASDVAAMKPTVDKAYIPTNILGTVSQTGGVPTGRIIERGSNGWGEYIRWADGTQICTFDRPGTVTTTNAWAASLYLSPVATINFPAAFVDLPRVSPALRFGGTGHAPWPLLQNVSQTSFSMYAVAPSNTGTAYLGYNAIGRWF